MNAKFEESERELDPLFFPTLQLVLKGVNFPLPSYLRFYQRNSLLGHNWILFAATEVNDSNPHPLYPDTIRFQYYFPFEQYLKIDIYRVSTDDNNLYSSLEFNIVKLLRSPNKSLQLSMPSCSPSKKGKDDAYILISIDEPVESKDVLSLAFTVHFKQKATIFQPKVYYDLLKTHDKKNYVKVLQSGLAVGNSAAWPLIQLRCSSHFKNSGILRIQVMDRSEKLLGISEFTFKDIVEEKKRELEFLKIETNKKGEIELTNNGTIEISQCHLEKALTFNDYLTAGLVLKDYYALDLSYFINSDLQDEKVIAFKKDYRQFLNLISTIFRPYTDEENINLNALGGIKDEKDYNFIPLSLDQSIKDVETILSIFDKSLCLLQKKTEIKLAPFLQDVITKVKSDIIISHKVKYYACIVILTEKPVDIQSVLDQLVLASYETPISFIILCLNENAFDGLNEVLGNPEGFKDSQARSPYRSNVKIVNSSQFSMNIQTTIRLLQDIPRDIWNFFRKLGILPSNLNSNEVYNKYLEIGNLLNTSSTEEMQKSTFIDLSPSPHKEINEIKVKMIIVSN